MTEFFSGMAVMAVELGASRLLAPYFSSSQIVWTIIIGTIMIAMALGNLYGGRSADKEPDPDRLYKRLLIAAVWIAAIPVIGRYVIVGISGVLVVAVNNNFLIIAAFLACMLLFVFPLFLLGTVTPSLARYTVDSLDDSGRTVGNLGAFNTVGSIIGTFLPTFVTIPAVGTSVTFLIFSGILLVLALVYFISKKAKPAACIISAVLFVLFSIAGSGQSFAFWEDDLTYEGESVYNYLQVKEDDDSVILSTNVLFGVQSIMKKDSSLTGMYYDYAMAAPVMADVVNKAHADILILGMGTGTYAGQCLRYFDNIEIDGVEIDEKITYLAEEYFNLPQEVNVTTYDGRAYLQAVDKKYDVIMVDAYRDITIPFQMSSAEFFTLVRDHLTDDGVMVVNLNMYSESEGNINEYICDTIASVFPEVFTVEVEGSTNCELFASSDADMKGKLVQNSSYISDTKLRSLMGAIESNMTAYEGKGRLFTDDKAAVELLGMQVIDEIIEEELGYYRNIIKSGGVDALFDAF